MDDRLTGVIGQLLVGDALTNLLVPEQHLKLWESAMPDGTWKNKVQKYADRPQKTRYWALAEGALGVYLIYHAVRNVPEA